MPRKPAVPANVCRNRSGHHVASMKRPVWSPLETCPVCTLPARTGPQVRPLEHPTEAQGHAPPHTRVLVSWRLRGASESPPGLLCSLRSQQPCRHTRPSPGHRATPRVPWGAELWNRALPTRPVRESRLAQSQDCHSGAHRREDRRLGDGSQSMSTSFRGLTESSAGCLVPGCRLLGKLTNAQQGAAHRASPAPAALWVQLSKQKPMCCGWSGARDTPQMAPPRPCSVRRWDPLTLRPPPHDTSKWHSRIPG